jgi:exonuclease VII small subunit
MKKANLNDQLKKLEAIAAWFDDRRDVDVEAGLEKIKEGMALVKASRERLREIENEFEEIKKDGETTEVLRV